RHAGRLPHARRRAAPWPPARADRRAGPSFRRGHRRVDGPAPVARRGPARQAHHGRPERADGGRSHRGGRRRPRRARSIAGRDRRAGGLLLGRPEAVGPAHLLRPAARSSQPRFRRCLETCRPRGRAVDALCPVSSSLLFGTSAIDAVTYSAVLATLLLVAALASYLPARRAARTDPVIALRSNE